MLLPDLFGFLSPAGRGSRAGRGAERSEEDREAHVTAGDAEGGDGPSAAAEPGAGAEGSTAEPRSPEAMLREVRAAGAPVSRVVYTRNRRVMVSFSPAAGTLRIHAAFAAAPAPVVAAVARLVTPRRWKRAARGTVREYLRTVSPEPAAPRPRARRAAPAHEPALRRMREEFARANERYFAGELPEVPLHLSDRMRRRHGHFSREPLEIVISTRLCEHAEPGEAEATVRHEMIHLWQHVTGRSVDHGRDFRRMARLLDVHPRATRDVRWRC